MLKTVLLTAALSFVAFNKEEPGVSSVIEGVVTNEQKQPLQNVHVYTALGEEEAFTNDKGGFSFRTYQAFPVKLVVESKDYEKKTIELTVAPEKLSILLRQK